MAPDQKDQKPAQSEHQDNSDFNFSGAKTNAIQQTPEVYFCYEAADSRDFRLFLWRRG